MYTVVYVNTIYVQVNQTFKHGCNWNMDDNFNETLFNFWCVFLSLKTGPRIKFEKNLLFICKPNFVQISLTVWIC